MVAEEDETRVLRLIAHPTFFKQPAKSPAKRRGKP